MKIKKIEITSFGKFKNYELNFSDGFNLIYGKNEDGKTTIMAFICLMLYGTAGTSSRSDISENLRKKYSPWNGEKMSGDIEIECEGRQYRIHKEFRATAKTDKVSVTDLETGNAVSLPPGTEIGKFFLGIDCNAFEKSLFGKTAESFAGSESGDIAARLSNLTENGDEIFLPQNALLRIDAAMDELVKKRSKGKIALTQDKIDDLKAHIDSVEKQTLQKERLNVEYKKTEDELADLKEKLKQSRFASDNEEKRKKAVSLRKLADLYNQINTANEKLYSKIKDNDVDEVLRQCKKLEKAVEVTKDIFDKTEKPYEKNMVTEKDMEQYFKLREKSRSELEESKNFEKKRKKSGVIALLGGLLFALGIICGIVSYISVYIIPYGLLSSALSIFACIAVPLGAFLFILSLVTLKKQSIPSDGKDNADRKMKELFESCGCSCSEEFERAYRDSIADSEKMKIYIKTEKELENTTQQYIEYINRFEPVETLDDAKKFTIGLTDAVTSLETARKNAEYFASACRIEENNVETLLNLAQDIEAETREYNIEIVNADNLEREINEKSEKLLEIKGLLGLEPEDIAPLIRELAENQERLNEMQCYYKDLSLAREVLLEAEDEMRRSFAPALQARASEILSALTQGKYTSLNTDKTYEIEVKSAETGGFRSRHYLSRGTSSQSYLALRLALCEMLFEKEPVPIFLDDVLVDYDDERAEAAAAFIEEYANNNRQILFFSCHSWMGKNQNKHNML